MADRIIETTVTAGQFQGVVGAGTVVIENFTIYNRAVEEPAVADAAGEPIAPCPYPGLAYFGPGDADMFFRPRRGDRPAGGGSRPAES
jgi:hypothetical protein